MCIHLNLMIFTKIIRGFISTIQPQGMDEDSKKAFQQYMLVKNPYRNAVAALIYASFIKCKRASSYQ
ncbi:hypothetical protein DFZ02_25205 [Escherichia coli]|nr:hypothetical protein [Escherichia coli]